MSAPKKSVVFVCLGNACRSQIAEGLARHLGGEDWEVYSAGSHPAGFVAPEAIEVLREKGIDISHHYSKGIPDLPSLEFDFVVAMGCGDHCPTIKGRRRLEWKIQDPIGQPLEFFREVRDDIEERIRKLFAGK